MDMTFSNGFLPWITINRRNYDAAGKGRCNSPPGRPPALLSLIGIYG